MGTHHDPMPRHRSITPHRFVREYSRMRASASVAAIGLCVSLVGCILPGRPYRGFAPLPHVADREEAIRAVVGTLQEHGYAPSLVNERVGTVSTDWRTGGGWAKILFGYTGRDRVNMTVTDTSLIVTGEYQSRQGASLLSAFSDKDQSRRVQDTDWFASDPPSSLRQEWDRIRADIHARISSLPPAEGSVAVRSASVTRSATPIPPPRKSASGERVGIAVVEFTGIGLTESEVRILTDRLRAELVDTGVFKVVERERMEEILREQGFQQSGLCDTDACVVEIGRLVGVSRIVAGTIGKLGNTYTTTVRLINVETGEIIARASDDCPCEIEGLLEGMGRVANVLAERTE